MIIIIKYYINIYNQTYIIKIYIITLIFIKYILK